MIEGNMMQPGMRPLAPFRPPPAPGSLGMRPPFRSQSPTSHAPARPSQPMSATMPPGNAFRPVTQGPPNTGGFAGMRAPGHAQPMFRPPTPQSFTPPPSPPPPFTPPAPRPEGFAPPAANPRSFAPPAANPRPFGPPGMVASQFAPGAPISSPSMGPPPGHVPIPSAPSYGSPYVHSLNLEWVV